MVLNRLTKVNGAGISTDTNLVANSADFSGITTSATSFNIGVTTIHSTLIEAHNIKSTGIITATGAHFSGNVSIAGTLTYEDVTNIDSVGFITARSQLNVGNNIKLGNAGVITATSFVGDGSGLIGVASTDNIVTGTAATFTGGVDINSDLDVDGHTNLDNVSIAGVTTTTDDIIIGADNKKLKLGVGEELQLYQAGNHSIIQHNGGHYLLLRSNSFAVSSADGTKNMFQGFPDTHSSMYYNGSYKIRTQNTGAEIVGTIVATGADINGDIDVDGHTNLDNVSIAGVTTFASSIYLADSIIHEGDTDTKIDFASNQIQITAANRLRINLAGNGYNTFYGSNNSEATSTYPKGTNATYVHRFRDTEGDDTEVQFFNTNVKNTILSWNDYGNSTTAGNLVFKGVVGGSGVEHARFTGSGNFNLLRDLDVDGHTNLDNVSIAGVTTFAGNVNSSGNVTISNTTPTLTFSDTDQNPDFQIKVNTGHFYFVDATNNQTRFYVSPDGGTNFQGTLNVGAGVTIETNGQATYTGIVTASSFKLSDGSAVGGVESDAQNNTVAGTNAGDAFSGTDAIHNTLYGYNAGTSITSADYNVAIGSGSLATNTTANQNVAVGYESLKLSTDGMRNVAVGHMAGEAVTTGLTNTIIGYKAGRAGASSTWLTTGANNIIIGNETAPSASTVSNEITLGNSSITKFRIPGLSLEFAKDHTYGVTGGRKNWLDNGSFDCIGGRRANTSMDYGNHHAYGWVTDRFQSRNSVQWTRSSNVPAGKGFSYSTQTNGVGGRLVQAVELPDYGDMGVFAPGSYWCVSVWSTAGVNQSGQAFSYDLGSTKTDIPIVHPSSGGVYQSTGETASGTSTGTFTRYYAVFQMPNSIISTATSAYWTWAFTAAGYHTGFQLERVPTATSKPTPYEHVHPAVTIARCRRYCWQNVNSRLINGYKRHDSNIHWQERFPVPPTHMPSGSNQSVVPYGIHLHDGGLLTNFQSVLQNPGVNSVSITEFDYRSGRFLIVGSTSWSSTHTTAPAWESQEYEIAHGHF